MFNESEVINLLKQLVSIPSVSGSENELAEFVYDWLTSKGLVALKQFLPDGRFNVITTVVGSKEGPDRRLLIAGHLDTVSPESNWMNPYTLIVKGEFAYGLGAADMKAGISCMLMLAAKFFSEPGSLRGKLTFAFLVDEEQYSMGAHAFIETIDTPYDIAIFPEPHFEKIVIGAPGKTLLELNFHGIPGHSSDPLSGVNSIDLAGDFLYHLKTKYPPEGSSRFGSYSALNILTNITNYSLTIPSYCKVILNKQLVVGETADDFIRALSALFREKQFNGILDIIKSLPEYPPHLVDQKNLLLVKLNEVLTKQKMHTDMIINSGVSDGNIIHTLGNSPSILFGPHGEHYHSKKERVNIPSMLLYMSIIEEFVADK